MTDCISVSDANFCLPSIFLHQTYNVGFVKHYHTLDTSQNEFDLHYVFLLTKKPEQHAAYYRTILVRALPYLMFINDITVMSSL